MNKPRDEAIIVSWFIQIDIYCMTLSGFGEDVGHVINEYPFKELK